MAEQNNSFPTISEKNWWTIREKFKSSLPSVVSTTYIKSLLSMANDNSANSNVISPLKRIVCRFLDRAQNREHHTKLTGNIS